MKQDAIDHIEDMTVMNDFKRVPLRLAGAEAQMPTADSRDADATRREVPGELGIWAFIFCDLSVFSFYFITFLYERNVDPAAFTAGARALNLTIGVTNTLMLLTSSLFVALGTEALRAGRGAAARKYVTAAAAGGLVFVINKPIEWLAKLDAGLGPQHDHFFQLYYMMTGLHLLHVLVGIVVLAYLWRLAGHVDATASPRQVRFMENGASYWHLVDLIWLVLFALFYLLG